jgi:acetyl-CoA carboxylase carboxyltransferase component
MTPLTEGLGMEKVLVRANLRDAATGEVRDRIMHISNPVGRGLTLRFDDPADRPIRPLTPYWQKVVQARQRGLVYPYELMRMLAPGDGHEAGPFPHGSFVEHDLDESETRLVPVDRPPGENIASIVAGVITNVPPAHPEGMTRVAILGDPSRGLGSLAEAECRRICAALDLAEQMDVPLEWFAVSSGARISMESGTENMDWIGRVLRRLIEFTQAGGEVNVVVCGINVGAQPYWNAEATMLMHTRGILVMTANGALVLTGKDALDYSGGVSAEDNFGIGGYDRVMGPNGQAQYWAADVAEACAILLRHYEHTYRMPGEPFPRRVATDDPFDRDVGTSPHRGEGMATVAEIFSERTNPDRKRPFDIRSVMRAVVDADHGVLERWANMRDAETVVVWDAFIGGFPVALLGIESKPVPRLVPGDADGPQAWTSGTLFPQSSKKAARAINAASANRPLVVLANLSGFDGSPESMRKLQLEYGAEIGRAVTNFSGPIVFLVISRYHGGAFVVFSQTLNQALEVAAVEGSYASVIGGAPAAAVVFAREIDSRVANDPAIRDMEERLAAAAPEDRAHLRAQLDDLRAVIRAERLGDVAEEFDDVHDIHRALKVGSVHRIIEPSRIRPYLIDALERGVVAHVQGAATTSSTSSP